MFFNILLRYVISKHLTMSEPLICSVEINKTAFTKQNHDEVTHE